MRRAAFFVALLLVSALFQVPLQVVGAGPAGAAQPAAGHYFPLPVAAKVADETVAADSSVTVKVRGVGGIPDSADVSAVAGDIVEFSPQAKGKVYVYPAGGSRPAGGQSYFPAGASSADFTVTRLSADGKITIQNGTSASLRIGFNAQGYYTDAPTGTAGDNGDTFQALVDDIGTVYLGPIVSGDGTTIAVGSGAGLVKYTIGSGHITIADVVDRGSTSLAPGAASISRNGEVIAFTEYHEDKFGNPDYDLGFYGDGKEVRYIGLGIADAYWPSVVLNNDGSQVLFTLSAYNLQQDVPGVWLDWTGLGG